ncbi:MAG: hypothetical protein R3B09_26075 [Nannocystaceae bacterium]
MLRNLTALIASLTLLAPLAISAPAQASPARVGRLATAAPVDGHTPQQPHMDHYCAPEPECFDVDIDVGATCGIVVDLDASLVCDPLSVEAACLAKLGVDADDEGIDVDAFVACTAELVAACEADVEAGGALFCDGHYIGGDLCLGGIDVDIDLDADACLDLDIDVDVDLGLCLDLNLNLDLNCTVEAGVGCAAKCDPISVKAFCIAELGEDCGVDALAACLVEAEAQCVAQCEADGALFCDGGIYAGADLCLDLDVGVCIGLVCL